MSRLIRDTDIIRKLNGLIEAINKEPDNVFYGKEGLIEIVNAIIRAVNRIDEAYDVEAVVRELESDKYINQGDTTVGVRTHILISDAVEIVKRGGRNE